MSDKNIENMDFKELREEVQRLRDELAIFKRSINDALENIDADNLATNYRIGLNNRFSDFKQTANGISAKVTNTESDIKDLYTMYEQTDSAIKLQVSRVFKAPIKTDTIPSGTEKYNIDNMYYYVDGDTKTYYYYHDKKWKEAESNSIFSQFVVNADGIYALAKEVVLDGNTFVNGEFETAEDDSGYSVRISTDSRTAVLQIRNVSDDKPLFYLQRAGMPDREIGDDRIAIFASGDYNAYIDFIGKINFGNADVYGLYAVFE